jgi:hypothetical protein
VDETAAIRVFADVFVTSQNDRVHCTDDFRGVAESIQMLDHCDLVRD